MLKNSFNPMTANLATLRGGSSSKGQTLEQVCVRPEGAWFTGIEWSGWNPAATPRWNALGWKVVCIWAEACAECNEGIVRNYWMSGGYDVDVNPE